MGCKAFVSPDGPCGEADAILRRGQQTHRQQLLADGHMRVLEHRPDRDGELLVARAALPQPFAARSLARRFRRQSVRILTAAVRAGCAVRPAEGFQQFAGRILVREVLAERRQILCRPYLKRQIWV